MTVNEYKFQIISNGSQIVREGSIYFGI